MPMLSIAAALAAAATAVHPAPPRPQTLRDVRGVQRPALDPGKAALIVIDAQEDYMAGPLALEGMPAALAEIRRLRVWAAAHHTPVIHIRQESPAGASVFAAGSHGAQIIADAAPAPGEAVVVKLYPNAFNKTDLDERLRGMGRTQVIVTGFMTHMCLDATARAAFDRDYQVFVVASATAERAIPGPDGAIMSAEALRRAALTALNDRFAWIYPDAASLEREAR